MDKEYLKMVLALPDEFFKDWQWKTGDRVINILTNKIVIFLWKATEHAWYYNYHPSFSNEVGSSIKLCEIRPVPNQRQLQEMIPLQKDNDCAELLRFTHFHGWVRGHDYDWVKNKSLECMWLEFVMSMRYGKAWNGKAWVDGEK